MFILAVFLQTGKTMG